MPLADYTEADFEALRHFVALIRAAGCQAAIVHARKAVLGGLSPKDNREVPPLRYEVVRRLKTLFPQLPVVVNGGLREPAAVLSSARLVRRSDARARGLSPADGARRAAAGAGAGSAARRRHARC